MKKFVLAMCFLSCFTLGCNIFGKAIEAKCGKELNSSDPKVRIKAAEKLGQVATSEAVRLLLLHEDDKNFRVKEAVKRALKKIDKRTFLN